MTKLGRLLLKWLKKLQKGGFNTLFGGQRVRSAVYPLQIPLPLDKNTDWQPFHIFKGATAGMREFSSHVSGLMPGHCPHPPHRHPEEELLLLLSGEIDIIVPDATDQEGKVRRHLKAGEFVYYPHYFAHTLEATGESAANYLMFKWHTRRQDKSAGLAFGCFNILTSGVNERNDDGFHLNRIFEGHTAYLSKLECHFSTLSPKAGYAPHVDNHDVVIVVLKGQVETLGQRVSPYDVIFYAAGEPHGMLNPGEEVAKYLVFEFHALKTPFLHWMHLCRKIINLFRD